MHVIHSNFTVTKRQPIQFTGNIPCAIIGAGPTGLTTAVQLMAQGVPEKDIYLIDAHDSPLKAWFHNNTNIGRNPDGYYQIKSLASQAADKVQNSYPITQPLVQKFISALRKKVMPLFEQGKIPFVQGEVSELNRSPNGIQINFKKGKPVTADRVILALGSNDQPWWPTWAKDLKRIAPGAITHVFDPNFVTQRDVRSGQIVIIGSDRSAVELALYLSQKKDLQVTLISKNLRKRDSLFFVDPCWLPDGNNNRFCLQAFQEEANNQKRIEMFQEARRSGALDPDHDKALHQAAAQGQLTLITNSAVVGTKNKDKKSIILDVQNKQNGAHQFIQANQIILSTGWTENKPKRELLEQISTEWDAPIDADSKLPKLDKTLQWAPNIYVTGELSTWQTGAIPTLAKGLIASEIITKQPDFTSESS